MRVALSERGRRGTLKTWPARQIAGPENNRATKGTGLVTRFSPLSLLSLRLSVHDKGDGKRFTQGKSRRQRRTASCVGNVAKPTLWADPSPSRGSSEAESGPKCRTMGWEKFDTVVRMNVRGKGRHYACLHTDVKRAHVRGGNVGAKAFHGCLRAQTDKTGLASKRFSFALHPERERSKECGLWRTNRKQRGRRKNGFLKGAFSHMYFGGVG